MGETHPSTQRSDGDADLTETFKLVHEDRAMCIFEVVQTRVTTGMILWAEC